MLLQCEFVMQIEDIILNKFGKNVTIPSSLEIFIKDWHVGGSKKKV